MTIDSSPQGTQQWEQVLAAFQRIWGYPNFRPPQGEIVRCLLSRRDALVVLPTGGGKSICFQLPALLQQGLTLVVSPLVALMENQVQELQQRQLPAAALHSQMPPSERRQVLQQVAHQRLRLLYLSPETLLSPPVWTQLCRPELIINGLVLDEAHCLVQWGDGFRPAYRRLGAARAALNHCRPGQPPIPVAAFTATAAPTAQTVLRQVLQLHNPQVVRLSPYRANLQLGVQRVISAGHRRHRLRAHLAQQQQHPGLVYVRTRRDSETLAATLTQQGYATAPYHAGLGPDQRRRTEADWMADRLQFVVATSAFGMGVNKPNTRWVLHYQAPGLVSEYVQEVGRAGRDGKPATALTLVSEPTGWLDPSDRQQAKFFAQQARTLQDKAQRLARQLPRQGTLEAVEARQPGAAAALAWLHSQGQLEWVDPFTYRLRPGQGKSAPTVTANALHPMLHGSRCRWVVLLEQFGFRGEAQRLGQCGHCDRCRA